METIFNEGKPQNIKDVLDNRDRRVDLQKRLLKNKQNDVIISAKLNIPGPIKNNSTIERFFKEQMIKFEDQLLQKGIIFKKEKEWLHSLTGPETFYCIDARPIDVKMLTVSFEDEFPYRRLFDLDVISRVDGLLRPITRKELQYPSRKCLICERNAKECGRNRTHSIKELQDKVSKLILNANYQTRINFIADNIARLGIESLIDEASAWPKPGLVDPVEHGAHPDMNYFLFVKSAISIQPYLRRCALAGLHYSQNVPLVRLFEEIREFGKDAENTMLKVTSGINTHKGAIFSLGIMSAALSIAFQRKDMTDYYIQSIIREMLSDMISDDFENISKKSKLTAGEIQFIKYDLSGIRGEAAAGYPTVFSYGLPAFKEQSNLNYNDRLVMTLLVLARYAQDTTLIKRAGSPQIIGWKDQQLDNFFAQGGLSTSRGRSILFKLQSVFSQRKLSLGGSADLLAVTIFVSKVRGWLENGFRN